MVDVVVLGHVVGGVALLVAGSIAAVVPKRRGSVHPVVGRVYVVLLVAVLGSGLVIGARQPGWSPFEIATPPTLAMGLVGFAAARRPLRTRLGAGWKRWHIVGMGGSLIGVVTATAFQVVPRLLGTSPVVLGLVWALPTVVGSTLIARAAKSGELRGSPTLGRPSSRSVSSVRGEDQRPVGSRGPR